MVISLFFSYKTLDRYALLIYGICILLLVWVLFFGKFVSGSRRWLVLGPISIQPSELVKLAVIIVLSRYYSRATSKSGLTLQQLIIPMLIAIIPFVLIVRQPDLGTAMIIALIAFSITAFVKIERRSLTYIIASGAATVPLVWFFLKGYQKRRILTFFNPDRDPLGAGYHIIQSNVNSSARSGPPNMFVPTIESKTVPKLVPSRYSLLRDALSILLPPVVSRRLDSRRK